MKNKYIVYALAGVLGVGMLILFFCSGSMYGTWQNTNPRPGNVFDGDLTIGKIKAATGSQHAYNTIFSDHLNHALSCTPAAGEKDIWLCLPFLKSPNPVTDESTYSDIAVQTSMTPLYLRAVRHSYGVYHLLDIEMSYVSPDCPEFGAEGCNYMKLPRYVRWGL